MANLVRRLDGIPLALELAAARVKVLSPEQIAARLSDRFRILSGGPRTALPRQQTLRATMDWSYQLLDEVERHLLRRLSVFMGSCTLGAVEAICGPDSVDASEVIDVLSRLVDKSLLVVVPGPENRYRLLETVRQYGRERLELLDDVTQRFLDLDKAAMGAAYALGMAGVYRQASRPVLTAALLRHALSLMDETTNPEQYTKVRQDLTAVEDELLEEAGPRS